MIEVGGHDAAGAAHARATPRAASASTSPTLGVLFSGDTLFHGGPGATGRSFADFPTILDSIRERLLTLPPRDARCYTGHGDETTIGAEAGNYDAWVARGHSTGPRRFPTGCRDEAHPLGCVEISVYEAIVVLHFLGLASLLGGFLVQMSTKPRGINNAMLHGVLTQLVTGILVGIRESKILEDEDPLDKTKIVVKLGIALVVFWCRSSDAASPTTSSRPTGPSRAVDPGQRHRRRLRLTAPGEPASRVSPLGSRARRPGHRSDLAFR